MQSTCRCFSALNSALVSQLVSPTSKRKSLPSRKRKRCSTVLSFRPCGRPCGYFPKSDFIADAMIALMNRPSIASLENQRR